MKPETAKAVLVTVLVIVVTANLMLALVRGLRWEPKTKTCIAGGYADWTTFSGEDVCYVKVDGEWQIEPLADVQERLESK